LITKNTQPIIFIFDIDKNSIIRFGQLVVQLG
jgi:hypothetical protein